MAALPQRCLFQFVIRNSSFVICHRGFQLKLNTDKKLAIAGGVGVVGVIATLLFSGAERFWINWILWFLFLLTIGLGCLFLVALEHVVGAKWSIPLRRVPERLAGLALLMGPAALLALFSLRILYPWAQAEGLKDPIIAGKAAWLNVSFFTWRVVACLFLWLLAFWIFVRGSIRQDQTRDPRFNLRARRFAPVFMGIFAIIITVLAFDWISSLEPMWYSDIFGVYLFAGTFLAGLAATTLALLYLKSHGRLAGIGPDHIYNLGGFLFAFTVFWSYIGFAQYMLMWYANMPEEVFWYTERLQGAWGPLLFILAIIHFLIPFFILIPRDAKSNPRFLFWTAMLMLFSHWLDLFWMIFPALGRGVLFSWQEISFSLLFLSAGLLWVRRSMKFGEDMPVGDPMLNEGLEFRL
jgi:hypothetical protein